MPLELLLTLVVGGIAMIALALHMLGKTNAPPMTEQAARAGWLRHFPDDAVVSLRLAQNGRAALVTTARARGLVWQFGADTVARYLGGHQVRDSARGLALRFSDFGTPGLTLLLTPEETMLWKPELEAG